MSPRSISRTISSRTICSDVVDRKTGEIFLAKDAVLTEEHVKRIKKSDVKKIRFLEQQGSEESVIAKTISKDQVRSEEDALTAIYKQLRSGEAPGSGNGQDADRPALLQREALRPG